MCSHPRPAASRLPPTISWSLDPRQASRNRADRSLDETLVRLRAAGVPVRGDVVTGNGGRQALVEDASGNPLEVFEPAPR